MRENLPLIIELGNWPASMDQQPQCKVLPFENGQETFHAACVFVCKLRNFGKWRRCSFDLYLFLYNNIWVVWHLYPPNMRCLLIIYRLFFQLFYLYVIWAYHNTTSTDQKDLHNKQNRPRWNHFLQNLFLSFYKCLVWNLPSNSTPAQFVGFSA